MLNSQTPTSTPAKPKILTVAKTTFVAVAPVLDVAGLENKVRARAHQLYEGRGCEPGMDQQDWFQAEHELNQRP